VRDVQAIPCTLRNMDQDNRLKEYGWGSLIAVIGSCVAMYMVCTSCRSNLTQYIWNVIFSSIAWMSLWIVNGELNHYLNRKISWINAPLKRLIAGIIGTVVITVVVVLVLIRAWEFAFDFRFHNYYEIINNSLVITFFISLFFHGRSFLMEWKRSAVEAERYQKESMAATYESLKNQVNPHFLFNSFNALTNLVYQDQDKAAKFIKQLSEVYRYVLDTRDREVVPIDDEVKFLESYTYLQHIRFGNKVTIEIDLKNRQIYVAPLAVQMLIENAIKHNITSEDDPLYIKVYYDNDFIVVKNNLQKKQMPADESAGVGLENISKRYAFLSNKKVDVYQDEKTFIVKLPALTQAK
jgi:sensor histidine kinase YesM